MDALRRIVSGWRADNAASGVPVYGHEPFPKSFAQVLVHLMDQQGADADDALQDIVASVEPDARTSVAQQIGAQFRGIKVPLEAPGGISDSTLASLEQSHVGQAPPHEVLLSSGGDDSKRDKKNPFPYPQETGTVHEKACSIAASRCVSATPLYSRQRQQCGFALRQCNERTDPSARASMTQDTMYVVFSDGTVVVIPKHGPVYIKGGPDGPGGFRTGGRFGTGGFKTKGRF